jgi:hypothetical protein
MFKFLYTLSFFIIIAHCYSGEHYPNFDNNPYLSDEMRSKLRPYLLPKQSPIKPVLDRLFSQRVSKDENHLIDAGFRIIASHSTSFIHVLAHPELPNFLIKLYIDSEHRSKRGREQWEWLLRRCKGAENIRKLVKNKRLKYFVAPKKWIYPLPVSPPPPSDQHVIILIAEDMHIVSLQESMSVWRNNVNKKHLKELYTIVSHGYGSTYLPYNIPYTRDGKFACIDTEHARSFPHYEWANLFLSPEMQECWNKLVNKGGK